MASLAKRFVDRGVAVPLTYNDAYMGGNYATGQVETCKEGQDEGGENGATGEGRCGVEVYGVDSYPQVGARVGNSGLGEQLIFGAVFSDSIVRILSTGIRL
jgi:hypothetical protein